MSARDAALARLAQTDRELRAGGAALHTLDPARERPTALRELGERLLGEAVDPLLAERFAENLRRVALSQLEHFAHNLFWDFDYLAASLWRAADAADEGSRAIDARGAAIAELLALFGRRSPIRFRYVHDFAYGLDWERWVRADPARHAAIGPFDPPFLAHVRRRGREIRGLVETGADPTFPPLSPGSFRNPFAFSREPEHELRLHRELAARGLVPVSGWRLDARPDWRLRATRRRVELARELGIPLARTD